MNCITSNVIEVEHEDGRYLAEVLFYASRYKNIISMKHFKTLPHLLQMSYLLNAAQYEKLFQIEKARIEQKYNITLNSFIADIVNDLIFFE